MSRPPLTADARADGLEGRRALVMGLGRFGGGLGAARFLIRRGARVTVTDLRDEEALAPALAELAGEPCRSVLGRHCAADFEQAELVVANPAVPQEHPLLERARAAGARVTSEIELLLESLAARVVCITGTQGKTSTAHFTAQLLAATGARVHLGGNVGGSLLTELERIASEDVVVLELSSYQLAALANPRALAERVRRVEAVAITNVLADHLERHGGLAGYRAAKQRVLELLGKGGSALLPAEDASLAGWRPPRGERIGFSVESDAAARLTLREGRFELDGERLGETAALRLPGGFQRTNVLVALGLARRLGSTAEALCGALSRLRAPPHRLEPLGQVAGRRVHDNGVSTTPDSTVAALHAVPVGSCLIAGGRSKELPLDGLVAAARERRAFCVTFGEAREELARAFRAGGVPVHAAERLEAAVQLAFDTAPAGADVLFSPACASFDAYPNFLERTRAFRAALASLSPLPAPPSRPT